MKNSNKEQIVVFDFDKTITSVDTFTSLIVFLIKQSFWRQCFAIPFLPIIYLLKPFNTTKPYAVSLGLWIASVGRSRRDLIQKIKHYAQQRKGLGTHDVIRKRAFISIKIHIDLGHRVVIASASSRIWIKHILGPEITSQVTIIGSRLQYKWMGLVLRSWCYGEEKLEHFARCGIPQKNLRTIYSDSTTDLILMEGARNRCFINLPASTQKTLEANGKFYFLEWLY